VIRLTAAELQLDGLAGAYPLWVDQALSVPTRMLAAATDLARERGPLVICRPGWLSWAGAAWPLGAAYGRTLRGVRLVDADGCAWHGIAIELALDLTGTSLLDTLGHELWHAAGISDHVEAERLGSLLARASRR
jgi:hypothetical protein